MATDGERRLILDMVAGGKITAEEGARLLEALEGLEAGEPETGPVSFLPDAGLTGTGAIPEPDTVGVQSYPASSQDEPDERASEPAFIPAPLPPVSPAQAEPGARFEGSETAEADPVTVGIAPPLDGEVTRIRQDGLPPSAEKWHRWWIIPLAIGASVTVLGALLMFAALLGAGIGFLFFCAWIPFLLGLAVLILGWESRTTPWLHIRVKQAEGEWPSNIALSIPLPIHLAVWVLRTFRNQIHVPGDISVDTLILALENGVSPENPIYIEVDDGGDRVEVFIG